MNSGSISRTASLVLACSLAAGGAACAPAAEGPGGAAPMPGGGAVQREMTGVLVPAGHGTLRQDDFTVSIRSDAVLVKLTPLDESVIRLAAPDTYGRLQALASSRREEAARSSLREPELFLVSFFSYQPDVLFQPEDVQLFHQARILRASSIIPLTSGWGRQRLGQQETQNAIYVFDGPVDYTQAIRVRYGTTESDEWSRILPRLETERANVRTRAGRA